MKLETIVYVEPTAKGRPKLTTAGGFARAYTPQKTANAEAHILYHIRQYLVGGGQFAKEQPIKLTVTFFRARPKSAPKRVTLPVSRPDLDNYVKLVLDAINGYAMTDDSQVTTIIARKRFTTEQPRIYLLMEDDDEA